MHHQLIPDVVTAEPRFDHNVAEQLEERGHTVEFTSKVQAIIQAIKRNDDGTLTAVSDIRKGGRPDGY